MDGLLQEENASRLQGWQQQQHEPRSDQEKQPESWHGAKKGRKNCLLWERDGLKTFSNFNYKVSNVLTILYISKVQKTSWWIKFVVQLLWSATMEVWIKGRSCDMFILTAFVCLVVIIVPHLWKSTHALIKAKNNETYKSLLLLKGWALL